MFAGCRDDDLLTNEGYSGQLEISRHTFTGADFYAGCDDGFISDITDGDLVSARQQVVDAIATSFVGDCTPGTFNGRSFDYDIGRE